MSDSKHINPCSRERITEDVLDRIADFSDICRTPNAGWRARQVAEEALLDAIGVALRDMGVRLEDEYDAGLKDAVKVCQAIQQRTDYCDDPAVADALLISEASACVIAIRSELIWSEDGGPEQQKMSI